MVLTPSSDIVNLAAGFHAAGVPCCDVSSIHDLRLTIYHFFLFTIDQLAECYRVKSSVVSKKGAPGWISCSRIAKNRKPDLDLLFLAIDQIRFLTCYCRLLFL